MELTKEAKGSSLTISIDGRLDTTTAPQLEAEINSSLEGVTDFVIDMAELAYVSSAGLRVLLKAQKLMNQQGAMTIVNAGQEILEIFEVTGFDEILNIKK